MNADDPTPPIELVELRAAPKDLEFRAISEKVAAMEAEQRASLGVALMDLEREGKEGALNEQLRKLAAQQVAARETVKAEAVAHHKRTRQEHEAADRIREALADYLAKDRP